VIRIASVIVWLRLPAVAGGCAAPISGSGGASGNRQPRSYYTIGGTGAQPPARPRRTGHPDAQSRAVGQRPRPTGAVGVVEHRGPPERFLTPSASKKVPKHYAQHISSEKKAPRFSAPEPSRGFHSDSTSFFGPSPPSHVSRPEPTHRTPRHTGSGGMNGGPRHSFRHEVCVLIYKNVCTRARGCDPTVCSTHFVILIPNTH